jgi:transposase
MKKDTSILSQILHQIPRYDFQKAVTRHGSERYSKGFTSWNHFVSILFGQLSGQDSLRGIESGMGSQRNHLYHLGSRPVKRSTLSYASAKRSHEVFKSVFEKMYAKVMSKAPNHKFRFKNDLYSVDATTIDLCLSLYDWAKFRKTKGGIKLHVKLNHAGYIPEFVIVTKAKRHESRELSKLQLKSGDVVVFDRGYTDFARFAKYCDEGIYFITRLKKNADYRVVERRNVSKHKNISSDQVIELCGVYTKKKCPVRLRRIRVKDPETKKYIELLTNQMDWSPATIGAIYKDRWQIEIFFKTIKQNLKIKSFLGTSKNAILSQIWVAMIAYLLLSYMKFLSTYQWTINSLSKILPMLLFSRRNLWDWLNEPFGEPPPPIYDSGQLELI